MDLSQRRTANENPSSIVYERKFDTALRDTFYETFKNKSKKLRGCEELHNTDPATLTHFQKQQLRKYHSSDSFIESVVDELYPDYKKEIGVKHYPLFLLKILTQERLLSNTIGHNKNTSRLIRLVNKNIKTQLSFCNKQNYLPSGMSIRSLIKSDTLLPSELPAGIINLLYISNILSRIIDKSNLLYSMKFKTIPLSELRNYVKRNCLFTISQLDVTILWSETLCFIVMDGTIHICPRPVLLMYHNKVSDLVSVLLYAHVTQNISSMRNTYQITIDFVGELCKIIIEYGNHGFSILKVLEGLCIAETLLETEKWVNSAFLTNLVNELYVECEFEYMSSRLRSIFKEADIPLRHNLACLSKIVGHPYVDIKEGARSLHTKVTEDVTVDLLKIHECINYMKKDYIEKHIQRYKKWPPARLLTALPPRALQMAFLYNRSPSDKWIERKYGNIPVEDYQFVELGKNMELHRLENILPYLKDKTVSLLRSSIVNEYIKHSNVKKDWKETRLLLTYLLHPSFFHNHTEYLEEFEQCRDLEMLANYLIIRIVPKEKELKIKFRGFGAKSFEDRYRTIVQEKNVGIFLGEFSDEQSVTLSELDILKKLDAFRRIKSAYTYHHVLYIVVDASSWNNRFSARAVDDMMVETMDKLTNTQLFGKTHKAFEATFCYISDDDKIYSWEGQRGGIEGLNQYTWMLCYINQMKVAMAEYPFKYHIFCKGDDMRIVVLVPESVYDINQLRDVKNHIVTAISRTSNDFGHKINIEESYGSCRYFAFSKSASIDRIELPQSFRKIQKCYGANNAFINTLDDYIASTFSNGHSSCKVSPNVIPSYFVSLCWAFWYIINHELYQQCTDSQLLALMFVPSLLGGFPIIYLHNFFVRAESDLLSPYCDLYQYLVRLDPQIAIHMKKFHQVSPEIPKTLSQIFMDPYSIPITRPPLPSSVLRSYIPEQLKRICKNEHVRELIDAAGDEEHAIIVDTLSSCNIIRARILSVLYNSSPRALLDQFLRQFESGKSVLELLLIHRSRGKVNRLLMQVLRSEVKLQTWRVTRLSDEEISDDRSFDHCMTRCPTQSADQIREYSYGRKVMDVTMPPLQHQLIALRKEVGLNNDWARVHHFTYTTDRNPTFLDRSHTLHYAQGKYKPFIGFTTRTGNIAPTLHFVEKDPALSKIKDIIQLLDWANIATELEDGQVLESNIDILCEQLLKTYTSTPKHLLAPFAGRKKSGTVQHHMRSPSFKESIVPNTLSNVYTMISGESNSHLALRTSNQHYTINLLHCYCYAVWLAFQELEVSDKCSLLDQFWVVTCDCTYCNRPILEEPIIFNPGYIQAIKLQTLQLVEITNITKKILTKSLDLEMVRRPVLIDDERRLDYNIALIGLLQHVVDIFYIEWKALIVRSGGHSVTDEGLGILQTLNRTDDTCKVGITELKRMDSELLFDNLVCIIINIIYCENYDKSDTAISTWLCKSPIYSFPWMRILQWLFVGCRLAQFVKYLETRTGLSPNGGYYRPYTAGRYVGRSCFSLRDYIPVYQIMVCLHHYEPANLFFHIRKLVKIYRHMNRQILTDKRALSIHDNDITPAIREAMLIMLFQNIMVWQCAISDEYTLQETSDEIIRAPITLHHIAIIRIDDIEIEGFIQFCTDLLLYTVREDALNYHLEKIRKIANILLTEESIDGLIRPLFDQILAQLRGQINNLYIYSNIYFASISECIELVRNHPNVMEEQIEDDEITGPIAHEHLDDLHVGIIQQYRLSNIREINVKIEMNRTAIPCRSPVFIPLELYHHNSLVYLDAQYAPYGHGNASASRIYNIVKSFNIHDRHNDRNKTILCLHDGIGNITNLFLSLYKYSNVIFHTTPDADIPNVAPVVALGNEYTNTLHYQYLHLGYTCVSDDATREYLNRLVGSAHIIVSDLEHQDPSSLEYNHLQLSVLDLVVNLSMRTTSIILKYDMKNPLALTMGIYILRQTFQYLYLHIPVGETHWNYVYIVAYGYTRNVLLLDELRHMLTNNEFYGDFNSSHIVNGFIARVNRVHQLMYMGSFAAKIRMRAPRENYPPILTANLGYLGIQEILELCGACITNIAELQVALLNCYKSPQESDISIIDVLAQFQINIVGQQKLYESELMGTLRNTSRECLDLNTRTYRLQLLQKLFSLYGLYEFFCDQTTVRGGIDYNPIIIYDSFNKYKRKWNNGRDVHLNANFQIDNRLNPECDELYLLQSYNRGITIGVRAAFGIILQDRIACIITHDDMMDFALY